MKKPVKTSDREKYVRLAQKVRGTKVFELCPGRLARAETPGAVYDPCKIMAGVDERNVEIVYVQDGDTKIDVARGDVVRVRYLDGNK